MNKLRKKLAGVFYQFAKALEPSFLKSHNQTNAEVILHNLGIRIPELETALEEEIANRDYFEDAFAKAFKAATGEEIVWSSGFGVNEAIEEIERSRDETLNTLDGLYRQMINAASPDIAVKMKEYRIAVDATRVILKKYHTDKENTHE